MISYNNMVKGWSPISIKDSVKQKLEERYKNDKKRPKNQKFTPYVENLLIDLIEYEQALTEYGHILALENVTDNHIILMDNFIGKHVFVYFQEKHLFCEHHEELGCYHIGFCYALPVVYKALIAKGMRPKNLKGYKVSPRKSTAEGGA